MAHLARCWCSKVYRCEQDHKPTGCCAPWVYHHDKCPDFIFHGKQEIRFDRIIPEKFSDKAKAAETYSLDITSIIESNSVKEPL